MLLFCSLYILFLMLLSVEKVSTIEIVIISGPLRSTVVNVHIESDDTVCDCCIMGFIW